MFPKNIPSVSPERGRPLVGARGRERAAALRYADELVVGCCVNGDGGMFILHSLLGDWCGAICFRKVNHSPLTREVDSSGFAVRHSVHGSHTLGSLVATPRGMHRRVLSLSTSRARIPEVAAQAWAKRARICQLSQHPSAREEDEHDHVV